MNLSEISERISNILTAELDYSDEKKEVVAYGIESAILTTLGFLAILLVALIFNALVPAVLAVFFGGLLRQLSGGAHFNTPIKCLSYGAVVYSLLGVFSKQIVLHNLYNMNYVWIVLGLSFVLVLIFAPVDCEAKPIHSETFRKKLKIASCSFIIFSIVIILLSNNALLNTSAALGIGYQSITLLPVFNKK